MAAVAFAPRLLAGVTYREASGPPGASPRCCLTSARAYCGLSPGQGVSQCPSRGQSRRLLAVRAETAAAKFKDHGEAAYFKDSSPIATLDLKKCKKLAKKISKQRKALYEIAEMVPMTPGILENMVKELDKASAVLNQQIEKLKDQEEKSSSSSSSEDNVEAGMPAETDAAVVLARMRLERAEVASPATAGVGRPVCAMSIEDSIPSTSGRVFVCQGSACMKRGAGAVLDSVNSSQAVQSGAVRVVACKCLGKCKQGAAIRVKAGAEKPEVVTRIGTEHVDELFEYKFS
eukprot:scaffold23746_cov45-Prasinocladus_malaysianus.AAC.1